MYVVYTLGNLIPRFFLGVSFFILHYKVHLPILRFGLLVRLRPILEARLRKPAWNVIGTTSNVSLQIPDKDAPGVSATVALLPDNRQWRFLPPWIAH